jgi:hypothetical protein
MSQERRLNICLSSDGSAKIRTEPIYLERITEKVEYEMSRKEEGKRYWMLVI